MKFTIIRTFEIGKTPILLPVFYSVIMHSLILSFLIAMPIYSGRANAHSFVGYFVSLWNDWESAEIISGENAGKSGVVKADNKYIEDRKPVEKSEESDREKAAEETMTPTKSETEKMPEPKETAVEKPVQNVPPDKDTTFENAPVTALESKVPEPPVRDEKEVSSLTLPKKDDERGSVKKEDRAGENDASVQKASAEKPILAEKTAAASVKVTGTTEAAPEVAKEKPVQAAAPASERPHERTERVPRTEASGSKISEAGETVFPALQERDEEEGFKMKTNYEKSPASVEQKAPSGTHPSAVEVIKASPKATGASSKIAQSVKKRRKSGKTAAAAVEARVHTGTSEASLRDESSHKEDTKGRVAETQKMAGTAPNMAGGSSEIPHQAGNHEAGASATPENKLFTGIPSSSELSSGKAPPSAAEHKSVSTPGSNGTVMKADTSAVKAGLEGLPQAMAFKEKKGGSEGTGAAATEDAGGDIRKTAVGIPLAEAFFPRDIQIEASLESTGLPDVFMRLIKKLYPNPKVQYKKREEPKEVETINETGEMKGAGGSRVRRTFSVVSAVKGIYIFVMKNEGGKTCEADVIFRLYKGGKRERIKEYKAVQLPPGAAVRFKFILPDAVFWDDEDRFSGRIEDSQSITKFNYDSELYWKEDKD